MTKVYNEGKRSNHIITPLLYLKLWRRITYKRCESEVDVGGGWRTGHVCDDDIIILKFFQREVGTRWGMRTTVVSANHGIFGNHPKRARRRNGTGLKGGP